ncbi:MAG: amidohydrolase [Propionibacteriaceae bacterium]|jgi:predicted TIM-barrel fold metal-dependent hydrolase|nr:amidohydrolase [Propionibacteriaceae bacterium]
MIIDAHVHLGGDPARQGSPPEILRQLDEIEAGAAVTMPAPGLRPDNAGLRPLLEAGQGRFHGCAWVNPALGHEAAEELERCGQWGWKFVKLQPEMHNFSMLDQATDEVAEVAGAYGMTVIVHTGGSVKAQPWGVGESASRHPGTRFILDHMGGPEAEDVRVAILMASRHSNVWLGTSKSIDRHKYRQAVDVIGAERLVFGSDAPNVSMASEIVRVRHAGFSDAELDLILGQNALALIQA